MADPKPSLALTLAPAAGAGVGRLVAEELLSRPDFVKNVADSLMNGLNAKTRLYNTATRRFEEYPDSRVQLQAAMGILSHLEGDPIKRVIHQHLGENGEKFDPVKAVQDSPALFEAMERVLHNATTGRGFRRVEPVHNSEPPEPAQHAEPPREETAAEVIVRYRKESRRKPKTEPKAPAQPVQVVENFDFRS